MSIVITLLSISAIRTALVEAPDDLFFGGRDAERLQFIFESLTTMKACREHVHNSFCYHLHSSLIFVTPVNNSE